MSLFFKFRSGVAPPYRAPRCIIPDAFNERRRAVSAEPRAPPPRASRPAAPARHSAPLARRPRARARVSVFAVSCAVCVGGVPAPGSPGALTGAISSRGSAGAAACGMECGVAAAGAFPALSPTERSPAKTGLHVNFSDKGEVKERREKFLTAKYGSHQMALIRKRLAVEMWLYDELQKLYETPESSGGGGSGSGSGGSSGSTEVEVDIDELLDMDSDELRRRHLAKLLSDAKKPQKDVNKFINDLLEKAKTL